MTAIEFDHFLKSKLCANLIQAVADIAGLDTDEPISADASYAEGGCILVVEGPTKSLRVEIIGADYDPRGTRQTRN